MHLCESVYKLVWQNITTAIANLKLPKNATLLDVGCWDGELTEEVRKQIGLKSENTYGIDFFDNVLKEAKKKKLNVAKVDLEKDKFPFKDNFFDVVICNQVFEHLKNIYQPIDEIHRVLKKGGYLIFSVPNLSSFHNRLFLLFGLQPTSIRAIGPHIRGYTFREVKNFLELDGNFKIVKTYGVGFYPFPGPLAILMAKIFTSNSHTVVFVAQKITNKASWTKTVSDIEELSTTY